MAGILDNLKSIGDGKVKLCGWKSEQKMPLWKDKQNTRYCIFQNQLFPLVWVKKAGRWEEKAT